MIRYVSIVIERKAFQEGSVHYVMGEIILNSK